MNNAQENNTNANIFTGTRDNQPSEEQPFNSRYATRERIVRSYAAQSAQRARNARMHSQVNAENYKESAARAKERAHQREIIEARRKEEEALLAAKRAAKRENEAARARTIANAREHPGRSAVPLSSKESRERTRMSQENYEQARAMRDALSCDRQNRSPNRELIDARGSVDSRAFSENNRLVGYSINKADCPEPYFEDAGGKNKTQWHSTSSSYTNKTGRILAGNMGKGSGVSKRINTGTAAQTNTPMSHLFPKPKRNSLPPFVKVAVPIIIVLAIILFLILR